jgi:hypothetical protein
VRPEAALPAGQVEWLVQLVPPEAQLGRVGPLEPLLIARELK